MKSLAGIFSICMFIFACGADTTSNTEKPKSLPIVGTWKLQTGILIEKGDTTITDYTKSLSFIKVINETHFTFLNHDLKGGKDSTAVFGAGGGTYTLVDSTYTEHLEYCSDRAWEGHDFKFTIHVDDESFTQQGIEKVESAGIDRINIEKYKRVR